ncbi:MAG: hypothetical protein ICV70_05185 [Jiangellaceae bacterium]|nr:hypothetical protein [Jiangellaceae bacterium]
MNTKTTAAAAAQASAVIAAARVARRASSASLPLGAGSITASTSNPAVTAPSPSRTALPTGRPHRVSTPGSDSPGTALATPPKSSSATISTSSEVPTAAAAQRRVLGASSLRRSSTPVVVTATSLLGRALGPVTASKKNDRHGADDDRDDSADTE